MWGGVVCSLAYGPLSTVGSLYSGCFDELGRGLHRVLGPLSCVFVAELDDGKRKVLEDALSPLYAFSDVSEVKGKSLPVDVLCITPPCVDVTRNRRAFNRFGGVPIDLIARGAAAVSEQLAAITEAVHSSSPSVIVIEQSPGLASHHPAAYVAFNAGLQRLPYVYYHGSVEASGVCGASHARDRLVCGLDWDPPLRRLGQGSGFATGLGVWKVRPPPVLPEVSYGSRIVHQPVARSRSCVCVLSV